MILTTTQSIEGQEIGEYKGIVSAEVILAANVFRDFFASVSEIVEGRSKTFESKLQEGRGHALAEIEERAEMIGAEAIVTISFEMELVRDGMILISATGTAVTLK